LGTLASLDKDHRTALQHFQYASHLNPQSSSLRLSQSREFVELGQVDQAKGLLAQFSDQLKDSADYQVLVSKIASRELDVETASTAMDQAIAIYRRDGNDHKAREQVLAKVALLADFKRYEECIVTLQDYLKIEPSDEVAHYFLGKIYSVFQKRDEAKAAYRESINARPNFGASYRALGQILELEGSIPEAAQIYQSALENGVVDEDIYQKLVNLALILEDYPRALSALEGLLAIQPNDPSSQLRAGLIHFKLKNFDQARDAFRSLVGHPDISQDRVLFYLAASHEELKEWQPSAETYEKIPLESDYFSEARIQAANTWSENLKSPERAITLLQDALKLKPKQLDISLSLAAHFEKSERYQDGIELLSSLSESHPGHERVLFMLAALQDKAGHREQSIQTMKRVLEINPNNAHALNHIGYTLTLMKKDLDEAEIALKRAIQLEPENGFIMDSLGWLYYQKGQFKKSAEILERANALAPGQLVILEHLADAYHQMGRTREALAVYRQIMGWSKDESPESAEDAETKEVQERVKTKIASLDSKEPL
jgi:tetratricopeptide (TPR) repeat protein